MEAVVAFVLFVVAAVMAGIQKSYVICLVAAGLAMTVLEATLNEF